MDLLPIEIKVNVEGDVVAALSALNGSHGAMTMRRIWFAEDREGVAKGKVPLLDGGVIVRFRTGGGPDDLTVKLRPCTLDQLVGRFSDAFAVEPLTYKIEQDWSVSDRVLAASLVHTYPPGELAAAVESGRIRPYRSTRCRTSSSMPAHPPSRSAHWSRSGRSSRRRSTTSRSTTWRWTWRCGRPPVWSSWRPPSG
ncbi:hypothetical protein ACFQ0M_01660 [Kitasatospora aburaviensis]